MRVQERSCVFLQLWLFKMGICLYPSGRAAGELGGEEQGPAGPSTLPQGRMEGWKVNGDKSVTFPQEA